MATKYSMDQINQCRELHTNGISGKVISTLMSIPQSTVSQIINNQVRIDRKYISQPSNDFTWRHWNAIEVEFIRENAAIMLVEDIAKQLNRTVGAVRSIATKESISLSPRKTVDPHDKWLCQELFKEGLSIDLIAEKMELSRNTVNKIVRVK